MLGGICEPILGLPVEEFTTASWSGVGKRGGAKAKAAGHSPQPTEGHIGRSVGTAGQHKLLEVDL